MSAQNFPSVWVGQDFDETITVLDGRTVCSVAVVVASRGILDPVRDCLLLGQPDAGYLGRCEDGMGHSAIVNGRLVFRV